jgi:membrane dipeptidase
MDLDRRAFLAALAAAGAGMASSAWSPWSHGSSPIDALLSRRSRDPARRSGLTAVPIRLTEGRVQAAKRALLEWQVRFRRDAGAWIQVLTPADIERCGIEGKPGILIGFENATCIDGHLDSLPALHAAGTRFIRMTCDAQHLSGDGFLQPANPGLSDFGVAAVETMNSLGIAVDLSDSSEQITREAIQISRKPPVFLRARCQALADHPRAKTDELLRAMAERGGMVGIDTSHPAVLSRAASVLQTVDQIDHAIQVAGIDHVGLAFDDTLGGALTLTTRRDGDHPAPLVIQGLTARGYNETATEKLMGENWKGYFREVL